MTDQPDKAAVIARLRDDVEGIRAPRSRSRPLAERDFRWVGEPNGWRSMGQLANDLEELLNSLD